jgi:hypothetical protein
LTYEDDSNLGRHGEWIWTGEWKKEVERGEYKEVGETMEGVVERGRGA